MSELGKFKSIARSWLPYVAVIAVVYFGNVELQSYLGRKAIGESGLTMLSLEEALAKAGEEEKLVLADLSAIWCPSCRKLDKKVLSHPQVISAINQKYVFARVEYDSPEGKMFMDKYQVRGFPTLVVLNVSGEKLRVLPLTFDPEGFIAVL